MSGCSFHVSFLRDMNISVFSKKEPLRPLVSPKGWADAWVGIGMSWGGRDSFYQKIRHLNVYVHVTINNKFPIQVFLKISIAFSRFPRSCKMKLEDFSAHTSFPKGTISDL